MKAATTMAMALLLAAAAAAWSSPPELSQHQVWTLQEASRAGGAHETSRKLEFNFTVTLQAILGQESSWCIDKHRRDPLGWGCGQLTLATARLFDASATTNKLMDNDRYNIWLAATYLAYCRDKTPDWTEMVRCYKGRDTQHWQEYVEAIRRRLKNLPVSED
ncbi:MAG TPA: hypothetical protein VGH91_04605 [Gammaproteobacteria bacterium]|jgi:hypothetical protein